MAVFDPEIPQPSIPIGASLGYSKSYEGVSPFGVAVKGFSDVLGNAIQGADTVVKTIIEDGMRKDLGEYQAKKTSEFETIAGTPAALRSTVMPPLNILPSQPDANGQETPSLPADASQSLDRSLGSIAAGKKLRPYLSTYYDAGADKIVKDYQYRFPGYDKEITRIAEQKLGMVPANKLVSDLISVIQAGSDSEKSNLEKARTLLEKYSGRSGEFNGQQVQAWQMMQIINSGMVADPLTHVMRWASKFDNLKSQQDDAHSNATNITDTNTINADRAKKALFDMSATQASMIWNDALGKIPGMTPDQLNAVISKAQRGEDIGLDSTQLDILASSLEDAMRLGRMNLRQRTRIPGKPGEEPISTYVNGDVAEAQMNAGFKDIIDMQEALRSKDVGLIGRTARYLSLKLNDSRNSLINDPTLGHRFIAMDAANHFGGPQVNGALATQYLRNGSVQDLMTFFDQKRSQMMTPPTRAGEKQYNLLDVVNDAEQKGIGQRFEPSNPKFRPNPEQEREFFDKMVQFPGAVLNNPKTGIPLKSQVAKASFSNDTLGLIGKFETGPNRIKAWSYLTDKDSVVIPLKKLSQAGDPYVWAEGKSWADQEFRRFLFVDEINNLRTFNQPGIKIGYRPGNDKDSPSFYAYSVLPQPTPGAEQFDTTAMRARSGVRSYLDNVNASLIRLNAGIKGVANYIQVDGGDANLYVLKTMIDAGFDPKTATGIPGEMMKALAAPAENMDPFNTKTKGKSQKKPYE